MGKRIAVAVSARAQTSNPHLSCLAKENHLYITFVCCNRADSAIVLCGPGPICFRTVFPSVDTRVSDRPYMWFRWLDLNASSARSCCAFTSIFRAVHLWADHPRSFLCKNMQTTDFSRFSLKLGFHTLPAFMLCASFLIDTRRKSTSSDDT